jgi:hypothetical protein
MAKGKPSAIEVGDELVLNVSVVRVDEHEYGGTVTFALSSGQRFTIRQDSADIAEVRKAPMASIDASGPRYYRRPQ